MTDVSDFDQWNKLKKKLNSRTKTLFFSEREIWWCSLGKKVGHEEDGKNSLFERPVLIIKKFNRRIFLAVPLTSRLKNNKYYCQYYFLGKLHSALFSQIRLLDVNRLQRKVGAIDSENYQKIKNSIKTLI